MISRDLNNIILSFLIFIQEKVTLYFAVNELFWSRRMHTLLGGKDD